MECDQPLVNGMKDEQPLVKGKKDGQPSISGMKDNQPLVNGMKDEQTLVNGTVKEEEEKDKTRSKKRKFQNENGMEHPEPQRLKMKDEQPLVNGTVKEEEEEDERQSKTCKLQNENGEEPPEPQILKMKDKEPLVNVMKDEKPLVNGMKNEQPLVDGKMDGQSLHNGIVKDEQEEDESKTKECRFQHENDENPPELEKLKMVDEQPLVNGMKDNQPLHNGIVKDEEEEEEESTSKKRKLRNENGEKSSESQKLKRKEEVSNSCSECKQYLDQVQVYNGHPNNSTEEVVSISIESEKSLFTGEEDAILEGDEIPNLKLTHFSFYDKQGHLCPFDTGLIEKNVLLYASGYVKAIYEENPEPDGGCPTHDIGPINMWWITGFDGGEKVLVGIGTQYAEYYLMEPSPEYKDFWKATVEKGMVFKLTIEFLLDEAWRNPSYEDLIQHLESSGKLSEPEETLIKNAQYVCDQVDSYYEEPPEDEPPLITLPCMRALVKLAGVTFKSRSKVRRMVAKDLKAKKAPFSKATTTKLVRSLFENIFPNQIDKEGEERTTIRKKRCGVCEACQSPDCGKCNHCKDMIKFGGSGKGKQACKLRKCAYMAIQEAEESDNDDEKDTPLISTKRKAISVRTMNPVQWLREPTETIKSKTYYDFVKVGDIVVEPGDYVMLSPEVQSDPLVVAQVVYMYQQSLKKPMFHAHLFTRGTDTVIGETSDPRELVVVDDCRDCPLGAIVQKAEVEIRKPPEDWAKLGGTVDLPPQPEDSEYSFFIQKRYESSSCRFVNYVEEKNMCNNKCNVCKRKVEIEKYKEAVLNDSGSIIWRGETYSVGTAVFLSPTVYNFDKFDLEDIEDQPAQVDEEVYPEFYRKRSDKIKGSNYDTEKPFIVAIIESIKSTSSVKFRLLCRPDDTKNSMFLAFRKDVNLVYWTNTVVSAKFENVMGTCTLSYGENLLNIDDWTRKGPYRFYFTQLYDFDNHKFEEVPLIAMKIGRQGKGKGKMKTDKAETGVGPVEWQKLDKPLRCMDIFAGCGGLSEGLHQSGVAETKWAIEVDTTASQAFKLNNPDCKVFHDDCNEILRQVICGEGKKRGLPEKGEVEMLVGGPPCQGFSGMNRFNAGQYSLFKNSLIVSYLSYCEYYRPKYFILENVRNFVSFKRSMVLKLTIRCLLAMNYQVTVGVLQAGHYGVPQTRRRMILMAAAPGCVLPKFPEPQHVFNKRACQLSFVVNNNRYDGDFLWKESAPYRTICVRDAMSDLPDIKNGHSQQQIPYDNDPLAHFQRLMRHNHESDMVQDHICKEMSAIVEGRISHIPTYPGADWRDLPNISIRLGDGTMTYKLRYPYKTKLQSKNEPPRGVCACSIGKPCDPTDRQNNTLIPWCLPHTADRHNQWSGLYGRLEWDGFFSTTITNPEPMGKQGRVLHPEQNRVVSVRECARSQGFPDKFRFYGNILDKHRQVGNAVPPPLGCAIGREILKAYVATVKKEKNESII